jgi:hypothetical protein
MQSSAIWSGRSGAAYSFIPLPLDGPLDDRGGVFIFARQSKGDGGWTAICIGEARSFARELPAHPKRQCARNHAATHLHVLALEDEEARGSAVRDLIGRWHPPCNQTVADAIRSRESAIATC